MIGYKAVEHLSYLVVLTPGNRGHRHLCYVCKRTLCLAETAFRIPYRKVCTIASASDVVIYILHRFLIETSQRKVEVKHILDMVLAL